MDDKSKTIHIYFTISPSSYSRIENLSCSAIYMDNEEHFCVIGSKKWCFDRPFRIEVSKNFFFHTTEKGYTEAIADELYSWYLEIKQRYGQVYFVSRNSSASWPLLNNFVRYFAKTSVDWPREAKCSTDVYQTFSAIASSSIWRKPILTKCFDDAELWNAYKWWVINREMKKMAQLFKELMPPEQDGDEKIPTEQV